MGFSDFVEELDDAEGEGEAAGLGVLRKKEKLFREGGSTGTVSFFELL